MLKKAVMYVRVSSKEQADQGFSPEAQRLCLYNFARSNGYDVVREFEESETAKTSGRKEFAAMIAYVKERKIENILVEKTDRLHRNFTDYVAIEELTEKFGVTVYFVKEGGSIGKSSRSSDKTMYGIKTVMAKGFIDNLKEEVIEATQLYIAMNAPRAAMAVVSGIADPTELGLKEKLNAAKDLLDRAGLVKTEKVQVTAPNGIMILPAKDSGE